MSTQFYTHLRVASLALILCALLTACGPRNLRSPSQTANFQDTLTVMSFNIRHGCGRKDWGNTSATFFRSCHSHIAEIAAAIRSADPDIVGLQEVNDGQASDIAKALNLNFIYHSHNPGGYGHWWGNAVLSKFAITDGQATGFGGMPRKNRSAVSATVVVNGKPMAAISVHPDHRQKDDRAMRTIAPLLTTLKMHAILIGDLNMLPDDPRLEHLVNAGFSDTASAAPPDRRLGTWRSPSGRRIDYVFFDTAHFTAVDAKVVPQNHHGASDHLAYYATLRVRDR